MLLLPCYTAIVAIMTKGGRTKTSWPTGSSWQHGKTTVIRVPVAIADQILEYARSIDQLLVSPGGESIPPIPGDTFSQQQVILQAIDRYITWKLDNYHPNQNSKSLNTTTRAWDELRKFKRLIENEPGLLTPSVNPLARSIKKENALETIKPEQIR